ncbi:MAG: hypothetical protein AB1696_03150 [Planctomycetota bacterium]
MAMISKLPLASVVFGISGAANAFLCIVWIRAHSDICLSIGCFASLASAFLAVVLGLVSIACLVWRDDMERIGYAVWGILLGVLVGAGWIQIPGLLRSRIAANESATTGSLKTIAVQQAEFRKQREVDQDGDGVGEYGYLCELSGEITPRNKKATGPVSPPYISAQFCTGGSTGNGAAKKSEYFYRIYLIGKDGTVTDDTACDGSASKPGTPLNPETNQAAIDEQEKHFVVYAWPVEVNVTGQRCFFVNEMGETYGTKMNNVTYSGTNGPTWNAAFKAKGEPYAISGRDNRGCPDSVDGNIWTPAG